MSNIISAIINLVNSTDYTLKRKVSNKNRLHSVGEALEEYIKDLFANCLSIKDPKVRNEKFFHTFSYLGNKNNPPDMMLIGGDAIEVKKIQSKTSSLALNSSYPKAKLYANNPLLKQECRDCEVWMEKDMLYAIGCVKEDTLNSLVFVYGADFCAKNETYERIKNIIKESVETTSDIEFTESRELGYVKRVDPLGITYLRIRGMWGIENPLKVFDYVYEERKESDFEFMCIINDEKFFSFENINELIELEHKKNNFEIKDVKIKNPNNPAKFKHAKLITYYVEK